MVVEEGWKLLTRSEKKFLFEKVYFVREQNILSISRHETASYIFIYAFFVCGELHSSRLPLTCSLWTTRPLVPCGWLSGFHSVLQSDTQTQRLAEHAGRLTPWEWIKRRRKRRSERSRWAAKGHQLMIETPNSKAVRLSHRNNGWTEEKSNFQESQSQCWWSDHDGTKFFYSAPVKLHVLKKTTVKYTERFPSFPTPFPLVGPEGDENTRSTSTKWCASILIRRRHGCACLQGPDALDFYLFTYFRDCFLKCKQH